MKRFLFRRFSAPTLLIVSLWLVLFDNGPLWHLIGGLPEMPDLPHGLFLTSFFLFCVAVVNLLLTLLTPGPAGRWVIAAVLLVSAGASYFMQRYGVLFDQGMVQNVLETDRAEAMELASPGLVLHVLLFGLLPAIVAWRMLPHRQRLWDVVLEKASMTVLSLLLASVAVVPLFKDYASLVRNHREIRFLLTPVNVIDSIAAYSRDLLDSPTEVEPVGADAHRGSRWAGVARPVVTVLVVGETARADNFSLNGYGRPTNPELARRDVLNFRDVSACGTATAVSLPCMFSDLPRARYSKADARSREGLLDVVRHAGIRTEWLDNNSGCKGVCGKSFTWTTAGQNIEGLCEDGECFDEVLLVKLEEALLNAQQDSLIVLHMNGSHGPAYYRRYPDSYRRFTPDCRSDTFSDCSREEIVNSYDNTIYYTDHFLGQVIDRLDRYSGRLDTALMYVSDHGESLGEFGLYLHGTPYVLAPSGQTHVPLLMWLSGPYQQDFGLDRACLDRRRTDALSHDNLFHSVLGMLDIETSARDADLDLFASCHGPLQASHTAAAASVAILDQSIDPPLRG